MPRIMPAAKALAIFSISLAGLMWLPRSGPIFAAGQTALLAGTSSPVVIEWFKVIRPRAGQRETVFTQLLNQRAPVAGAKLAGNMVLGKKSLRSFTGGRTGKYGKAHAVFVVPNAARGRTVRVNVSLRYKGHTAIGHDNLAVKK